MTSLFESARKLRLPGIRVTPAIHPNSISPRIKSMAQKMLRTGVLTGGWNAQSKRLARTIIESVDPTVPYISPYLRYGATVFNSRLIQDYALLDELLETNFLLEVLRGCRPAKEREAADRYKQSLRVASIDGEYIGIGNVDNELAADFVRAFADTHTELTKARHAALASLLDGPKPIKIHI